MGRPLRCRTLHASYSWCRRCGKCWRCVKERSVEFFPPTVDPPRVGRGFFFVCEPCWAKAGEEELVMLMRRSFDDYWTETEFTWSEYVHALVEARKP